MSDENVIIDMSKVDETNEIEMIKQYLDEQVIQKVIENAGENSGENTGENAGEEDEKKSWEGTSNPSDSSSDMDNDVPTDESRRLLSDVGISVEMDYGPDGSGAWSGLDCEYEEEYGGCNSYLQEYPDYFDTCQSIIDYFLDDGIDPLACSGAAQCGLCEDSYLDGDDYPYPNGLHALIDFFGYNPYARYTRREYHDIELYDDSDASGNYTTGETFTDLGNGIWNEGEPFEDEKNGVWDEGELYTPIDSTSYYWKLTWTPTLESSEDFLEYTISFSN